MQGFNQREAGRRLHHPVIHTRSPAFRLKSKGLSAGANYGILPQFRGLPKLYCKEWLLFWPTTTSTRECIRGEKPFNIHPLFGQLKGAGSFPGVTQVASDAGLASCNLHNRPSCGRVVMRNPMLATESEPHNDWRPSRTKEIRVYELETRQLCSPPCQLILSFMHFQSNLALRESFQICKGL
jgi:hypothetical protein